MKLNCKKRFHIRVWRLLSVYLTKKLKSCQCALLFKPKTIYIYTSWPKCTHPLIRWFRSVFYTHIYARSRNASEHTSTTTMSPGRSSLCESFIICGAGREEPKVQVCVLHNAGNFDAQALKLIKAARRGQRECNRNNFIQKWQSFYGSPSERARRGGVICGRQGRRNWHITGFTHQIAEFMFIYGLSGFVYYSRAAE